jgi:hypothetical protein
MPAIFLPLHSSLDFTPLHYLLAANLETSDTTAVPNKAKKKETGLVGKLKVISSTVAGESASAVGCAFGINQ